jgi:hypothetical protein
VAVVLVVAEQQLLALLELLDQVVRVRNLLNLEFQDRLVLEMLVVVSQMLEVVQVVVAAAVELAELELQLVVARLKQEELEKLIQFQVLL